MIIHKSGFCVFGYLLYVVSYYHLGIYLHTYLIVYIEREIKREGGGGVEREDKR